jgi:hypothetical protein
MVGHAYAQESNAGPVVVEATVIPGGIGFFSSKNGAPNVMNYNVNAMNTGAPTPWDSRAAFMTLHGVGPPSNSVALFRWSRRARPFAENRGVRLG